MQAENGIILKEGGNVKIEQMGLKIALARKSMSLTDLRQTVSADTLRRITKGEPIRTKTVGRIAAALGVDVLDILDTGGDFSHANSAK